MRQRKRPGRRRRLPSVGKQSRTQKVVPIKYHTRSPRGADSGKPRVRVKAHRRGKPKDKR